MNKKTKSAKYMATWRKDKDAWESDARKEIKSLNMKCTDCKNKATSFFETRPYCKDCFTKYRPYKKPGNKGRIMLEVSK